MVFNGSITDFQSDGTGSNPVTRSKRRYYELINVQVEMEVLSLNAGAARRDSSET